MAKKNKNIVFENVELKPQVIGYTYQKKSNLGRVLLIFIILILVVYFINDISVFFNNLIGHKTADTIQKMADEDEKNINKKFFDNDNKEEIVYNIFDGNLSINVEKLVLNNFNYNNNVLTFDIVNNTGSTVDLSNKKYFLETFTENKTLIDRVKIDINAINANSKISYELDLNNSFYYVVIDEKTKDDYPNVTLNNNDSEMATITCVKDIETIVYTFNNNELNSIKDTITDNNIYDEKYNIRYASYQSKAINYNNISGITASFSSTMSGYIAIFNIDLQNTNLGAISEKYYYGYKEEAKVVKFEMQTYGFTCN